MPNSCGLAHFRVSLYVKKLDAMPENSCLKSCNNCEQKSKVNFMFSTSPLVYVTKIGIWHIRTLLPSEIFNMMVLLHLTEGKKKKNPSWHAFLFCIM